MLTHIVDIFHAQKHTLAKPVLGHADCKYHPHLEKFNYVRSMDTEITKQSLNH